MQERLLRSEVPIEATWNLTDLFTSDEAWKMELSSIQDDLSSVTQYQGTLHKGPEQLYACLQASDTITVRAVRAATYASLKQSGDSTNPDNQANSGLAGDAMSKMSAALSFVNSEILELPEGTIGRYLAELPELTIFQKKLNDLLEHKPHKLSAETEKVLASLGEVMGLPQRVYLRGKLSDMTFADVETSDGEKLPVSFALFENKYEGSPDTELRRSAYGSFSKTLSQYKNTFAEAYGTEVKKQVVMSRLRGYESVTHMLLESQQVSIEMYNNILDIIQTNLAPHMRRYARLKKRVLGLDKMMFCDLKAPLDPGFSPKISYDDACALIQDSLQIMGEEYSEIMKEAVENRWIDYVDNVGKSTGAFCSSPYGAHPYILVSWSDSMRGAFTLAHELGHAGHFRLAGRNQIYSNTRPSLYAIEAPSTMNEMLLADHIMKQSNDARQKRWVITQLLHTYYHNFVTHLLEGEMQRRVYALAMAGESLTAKRLCELKAGVLSSFWGEEVEIDKGASYTWMRQPHYYRGLYPYTYAAGLTVSTAAAQMIKEEGQPAVDRWLRVLKAGGTLKPLELFQIAGVDMSGTAPIERAVAYVGSLIDELEALYEDQ
ncbi:oligoendopeptidase F [Paenibacillus sp. N1-5-1-14]|uniref:oligoendopeptidase F n=1 Tax=Paenibacillus radicibacter TaxID=2972488 RepID=UPI0021598B0B|nr:oligoendopeptidase F [Paenibacillus radicibacter]MCR8641580.1 oligoendopeptidase F [Paenibacillus radicibacter]